LGAGKDNNILEISHWEQAKKTYLQYAVGFACSQRLISSMLFTLLAPKDLFPICCWLCLPPKTYFQYAVYFACSQRLISSMLLTLLDTGNKSLGASKVNSILEISLWEQAK
jgi:hypothetical protein